jgi:prophage antirepressor-like protein
MRALMAAVLDLSHDETKPATSAALQTTLKNMREMTRISEDEMHVVVLACKRARGQLLATLPASKPTLH